jgi:hypothetical protein
MRNEKILNYKNLFFMLYDILASPIWLIKSFSVLVSKAIAAIMVVRLPGILS